LTGKRCTTPNTKTLFTQPCFKNKILKNIAIFASGTGSNATKIVQKFKRNKAIQVALIVSNKATAPVFLP